jgi:hypothetical protein
MEERKPDSEVLEVSVYRILLNGSTVPIVAIVILVYCPRIECILPTIIVPFDFGQLNVASFIVQTGFA